MRVIVGHRDRGALRLDHRHDQALCRMECVRHGPRARPLRLAGMRHHGCGDPDPGGLTLIIWLNGAVGSGRTTLTRELNRRLPDAVIFDPEYAGHVLTQAVPAPAGDFQDLPS